MQCWKCAESVPDDSQDCAHCTIAVGNAVVPTPLKRGGCILTGRLGEGRSGGAVFDAFDPILKRDVAIKWFPSTGNPNKIVEALDEAQAMAAFSHTHIVSVYRCVVEDAVVVMERVNGVTLQELMEKSPQEVCARWRAIALGIAEGIRALHQRFMQHSDLKPANVMIERGTWRPLLTDFGLARLAYGEVEPIMNAQRYRAPELWDDPRLRHPAHDVFALGVIIYQMIAGDYPFDAPSPDGLGLMVKQGDYTRLRQLSPPVDPWIDKLVEDTFAPLERRVTVASVISRLTDKGGAPASIDSLDDCRRLIEYLYGARNRDLPPIYIATRLLSAMTGATDALIRRDEEGSSRARYYFPRVLAWTCAALNAASWTAVEALEVKYAEGCPVCSSLPCCCPSQATLPPEQRNHLLLERARRRLEVLESSASGGSLYDAEEHFRRVYAEVNDARSTYDIAFMALLEVAQVVDAYGRFANVKEAKEPELLALELGDVLAWLFALVERFRRGMDRTYDLRESFLDTYPGRCPDCSKAPCECPLVTSEVRIPGYHDVGMVE